MNPLDKRHQGFGPGHLSDRIGAARPSQSGQAVGSGRMPPSRIRRGDKGRGRIAAALSLAYRILAAHPSAVLITPVPVVPAASNKPAPLIRRVIRFQMHGNQIRSGCYEAVQLLGGVVNHQMNIQPNICYFF